VRSHYASAFPLAFETAGETATTFSSTWLSGIGSDGVAKLPARYLALDAAAIKSAAEHWLVADRMRAVVVGDWATLRAPLESLGWGPVELRTAFGERAVAQRGPNGRP
jgi:hypothetical protein